jgi:hypothetical protein
VASRTARRSFIVLLTVAATCGVADARTAKDVAPFMYRFQVTAVTMNATFTNGSATATTELHLSSRPKQKSLNWYGKKNYFSANGAASTLLRLAGTATYSGLAESCNVSVPLDSSRWKPIFASLLVTNARDPVVRHPTISASAGRFPLATTYPRRGGACEAGALPWYEGGFAVRPLSVVHHAGFSFAYTSSKQIEDGSLLEWTVKMTVRRLSYKAIDCRHSQLC